MSPPGILLGLFLLTISCVADFAYEGSHGPSHWGEEYRTCIGKHQSPINIDEHNVQNTSLPSLEFNGLENPHPMFLTNNGHTVMIRANQSDPAEVKGGPIGNETYVFEQLHFHWGANDREGSEDLINNHSFAMELHAVFYKKAYGSMSEATNHRDGVTVLAYFYEVGNESNPTYEEIVALLPNAELGSNYPLQESLLLNKLLKANPSSMQDYYTYEGSLTTPPCLEVVTWIDFKEPHLLSHEQITAFRNVRTSNGQKLTHNFRPIQPIEDRVIYHNVPSDERSRHTHRSVPEGGSGQEGIKSSGLVVLLAAIFFAAW